MLALGCDHGGYDLMQEVKKHLDGLGMEYKDFGTYSTASCDYPVYAEKAARAVADGECSLGILVCGTGIGMSIAANKINGVRAAHCTDCFSAEMARRHNNANMICLGARITGSGLALMIIDKYLSTEFEGGRHARRVDLMTALENNR